MCLNRFFNEMFMHMKADQCIIHERQKTDEHWRTTTNFRMNLAPMHSHAELNIHSIIMFFYIISIWIFDFMDSTTFVYIWNFPVDMNYFWNLKARGPVRPLQMHRSKDGSVYRHWMRNGGVTYRSPTSLSVWDSSCPSTRIRLMRSSSVNQNQHPINNQLHSLAHAPSMYLSTKYAKHNTSTGEDRGQRVTWGGEVFVPVAVVIDGVLLIGTEGNVHTQMSAALSSLEPRGEHRPHLHRRVGQHIWPITVRNAPPLKTTAEEQAQRFSLIRSLILSSADSHSIVQTRIHLHSKSQSFTPAQFIHYLIHSCTHKQTLETDSIILTRWAIHWLFDSLTLT